jgi:hypothetical protein
MSGRQNCKGTVVGLVAVAVLALATTAQAATYDAGIFTPGNGDAAHPIVITGPVTGGFLDTVNFDLGSFTHFNMTSTTNNLVTGGPGTPGAFNSTIFRNNGDVEIDIGNGYNGAATSFTNVSLPDLSLPRDYHLHPGGFALAGGGSYTLTLWGSNGPGGPAVPLPAAAWLFGSGVIGLAGLARRKMVSANA